MKKLFTIIIIFSLLFTFGCSCAGEFNISDKSEPPARYRVQYIFNSVVYTIYTDEVSYYGGYVGFDNKTVGGNWIVTDLMKEEY